METDKRPNILLITTDQQRFDTIRSLGNPLIRTPHIDHLVRNGIAFTSAYSDCPVCIPARWTLMNGLRAASYQHAYYQDRDPLAVDPVRSLPDCCPEQVIRRMRSARCISGRNAPGTGSIPSAFPGIITGTWRNTRTLAGR